MKKHPHIRGPNDDLMSLARRAKAAVDFGVTDELTAFMAVFHPEVDPLEAKLMSREARGRR